MKIKKKCNECGSANIRVDAWAEWNEETQEWELAEIYDNAFCIPCEKDCNIEEEEITS